MIKKKVKIVEVKFKDHTSNWYEFAKAMDMDSYELNDFADVIGLRNFSTLDASINPANLFKRNPKKFISAIKNASTFASLQNDSNIKKIINKTSPAG